MFNFFWWPWVGAVLLSYTVGSLTGAEVGIWRKGLDASPILFSVTCFLRWLTDPEAQVLFCISKAEMRPQWRKALAWKLVTPATPRTCGGRKQLQKLSLTSTLVLYVWVCACTDAFIELPCPQLTLQFWGQPLCPDGDLGIGQLTSKYYQTWRRSRIQKDTCR